MYAYIHFFLQYERNRGVVSQLTVRIIFKNTHFLYPFTYWLTCRLVQFLSVIKGVSINMDVQVWKGDKDVKKMEYACKPLMKTIIHELSLRIKNF